MLQFTYIASALYLSSKSKPTNVKQLHQIRNLYQLWLNFISGFRPPLKALLAWVALPVEFSDPHGLFQGWSFFGPLNSLHFPRENPSTPSTEEDGWPMGTTSWLPAPSLPGGPVPTLIAGVAVLLHSRVSTHLATVVRTTAQQGVLWDARGDEPH